MKTNGKRGSKMVNLDQDLKESPKILETKTKKRLVEYEGRVEV